MEQQIICLSDVRILSGDHQAIPLLLLQIYLYVSHERSASAIYLSRVTQAVGIREGLNFGSSQGVFVIYL